MLYLKSSVAEGRGVVTRHLNSLRNDFKILECVVSSGQLGVLTVDAGAVADGHGQRGQLHQALILP